MWRSNLLHGFSLIELIITVGLIAVVTAGGWSMLGPGPKKAARDADRKADLQQIVSALEIYRSDHVGYPACPSGTNCVPFVIPNYLSTVPTDPTPTNNYRYITSNCSGGFCKGYTLCAALEKITTADANCSGSCGGVCSYSVSGP